MHSDYPYIPADKFWRDLEWLAGQRYLLFRYLVGSDRYWIPVEWWTDDRSGFAMHRATRKRMLASGGPYAKQVIATENRWSTGESLCRDKPRAPRGGGHGE